MTDLETDCTRMTELK